VSPPDSTSNMHNLLYPISFKLVKDMDRQIYISFYFLAIILAPNCIFSLRVGL